eukprot:7292431-Alexandrium_andersonii.AAC.1
MSASLVGSEMCIRDSCAAAPRKWLHSDSVHSLLLQLRPAVVISVRVGAVSYTHLTLPTICSV